LRSEEAADQTVPPQAFMVRIANRGSGLTMDACGATRLLVPGFLIGVGVSSVTGSDVIGWAAVALTVGVLVAVRRIRVTGASCAIAPTDVPLHPAGRPTEPVTDTSSPN
jgi:hypothetical protein